MSANDDSSVISGLRASRARRQPPTRRIVPGAVAPPQVTEPPATGAPTAATVTRPSPATDHPPAEVRPAPAPAPPVPALARRPPSALTVPAEDPTTNYAVRVRRTLDELLSQRLGELRARGTRSSKVEVTELLLWELARSTPAQLDERLAEFRRHAPR